MYPYGSEFGDILSDYADRFAVEKCKVKKVFVDETLFRIGRWSGLLAMDSL
jgi:hypothetical protein